MFPEPELSRGADLRPFMDIRGLDDAVAAPTVPGADGLAEALAEAFAGLTPQRVRVAADNLFRLGLIADVSAAMVSRDNGLGFSHPSFSLPQYFPTNDRGAVVLSDLGAAFVQACTPPELADHDEAAPPRPPPRGGAGGDTDARSR